MNAILERSPCESVLELGNLRTRPSGKLLRIGWRLACALADRVRLWRSRARERAWDRRMVPYLTQRELSDMRMTRQQIEREINKPFWRV